MVKRGNTKGALSVTVDNSLLEKFKTNCKNNAINKFQLIESFIKSYLEDKKQ